MRHRTGRVSEKRYRERVRERGLYGRVWLNLDCAEEDEGRVDGGRSGGGSRAHQSGCPLLGSVPCGPSPPGPTLGSEPPSSDLDIEIARTSIAQGQEGSAFLVETY